MWKDASDGRFATKSAWQLVHTEHTIQTVYNMIWSSIIPMTVSFFCWRLWQDLIPVDVVIQRRIGSHIVSRYERFSVSLQSWRFSVGSYKINIDGCVKDGFTSGEEIIRNSSGQCVRAFFSSYGECLILKAALRAILDGIILA
ncbi:RNase H family protein [Abeliophyllum distichum]|uniref:RNase H family protein n=1 Tax=Abeliophyllum distichum TaxID=126358 RepID=A0ABD1SA96_9LAMI